MAEILVWGTFFSLRHILNRIVDKKTSHPMIILSFVPAASPSKLHLIILFSIIIRTKWRSNRGVSPGLDPHWIIEMQISSIPSSILHTSYNEWVPNLQQKNDIFIIIDPYNYFLSLLYYTQLYSEVARVIYTRISYSQLYLLRKPGSGIIASFLMRKHGAWNVFVIIYFLVIISQTTFVYLALLIKKKKWWRLISIYYNILYLYVYNIQRYSYC